MSKTKLDCEHCGALIVQYYSRDYNGNRGKCKSCGVDFPLD
ncbi:MAG: hypothetical protein OXC46_03625 [Thaumarchaeota archaeon]|nr:hypothetical protein [Nitrososphaerota archaeon]